MATILTKLDDQALIIIDAPLIASGDVNENKVHFDFDSSWENYNDRFAIFYRNKKEPYIENIDASGYCKIPNEVLVKSGIIHFGAIGNGQNGSLKTSRLMEYKIVMGSPTKGERPSQNGVAVIGLDDTLTREGMAADAKAVGEKIASIGSGEGGSYILPIASNDKLGGVKPVFKTSSMTQSVGVDSEGRLYTAPSGGGSTVNVDSSLSSTSTNPVQNKIINAELNKRVKTESGKGLSSNDFTDDYKSKVDSLVEDYQAILGVL